MASCHSWGKRAVLHSSIDTYEFRNSQRKADAKFRLFGVPFEHFFEVVLATTLPNKRGDRPCSLENTERSNDHVNFRSYKAT
jgi:hypothetical protein